MSLLAYSPLAGGMLSGKYLGGAQAVQVALHAVRRRSACAFASPIVSEAVEAYAKLAKERGLTLVQLALGYVKSRWFMSARRSSARRRMPQLEEDIEAAQFELDDETLAAIAAIQTSYPNPAG